MSKVKTMHTWNEVEGMVKQLAQTIRDSGFKIDFIGGIPRGGWPVATLLCQAFDIRRTLSLDIDKNNGHKNVFLYKSNRSQGKNILLVEDSLESGETLNSAVHAVAKSKPAIIKTAALAISKNCKYPPSYYLHIEEPVLSYPWDK